MSGQATLFAAQTALVENPPPPEPANTDYAPATGGTDLVCFSHLRWNFVFQRPQHLLTRFARAGTRVFFVEEPVFDDEAEPRLETMPSRTGVTRRRAAPARTGSMPRAQVEGAARAARPAARASRASSAPVLWYYTPMALRVLAPSRRRRRSSTTAWTSCRPSRARRRSCSTLRARAVRRAPTSCSPAATACTRPSATGTRNVHSFPSSVDVAHFAQARAARRRARRPGRASRTRGSASTACIDERMDLELLARRRRRCGRTGSS